MVLPGAAPPGRAATSLTAQKFSWNKKHRLAIVNGTTAPSLLRLRQHVEQEFIVLGHQVKSVQRLHVSLSSGATGCYAKSNECRGESG